MRSVDSRARRTAAPPAPRASLDFRALFEQELPYVSSTLRRLGVGDSERDDVAHEVFLRIHDRLGDYDPSRPLRPWIFGFAFRCAAEHRRLARHRLELVGLPADPVDPQPPPDEAAAVRDERDLVNRALDSVAIERRAVLLLHDVEGASAPEIASVLGIPLNTVYSRLRVARQELSAAVRRLQQGRGELSPVMLLPALLGAAGDGEEGVRRGWLAALFAAHPLSTAAAALAIGMAVGAGGYAALVHPERSGPPARTVAVEREAAHVAPSAAESAAPLIEEPAPAPPQTPAPSALATGAATAALAAGPAPAASAPDRDGALAAEQRLLDQARLALSQGDPAAAGALLDRHARLFPRALLAEEREALAIEVLAASGRLDEARAAVGRFRSRYPNSLFTSALRSAAGEP
jgi:RNA polymerase sigma-70 factor (ECF subfamily)